MTNLIVVFPKPEDAKSIRNILVKNGYPVAAVCTSGAQTLQYADDLHNGITISAFRLPDMISSRLRENLSPQFDMLVLASRRYAEELTGTEGVTFVEMPLKVHELLEAVDRIIRSNEIKKRRMRQQPKERNSRDRAVITEAKEHLMTNKGMTEEEAHRYLQKISMDNGVNMIETAQMVLSLFQK